MIQGERNIVFYSEVVTLSYMYKPQKIVFYFTKIPLNSKD